MNPDRIEGKLKETEGEAQQALGKLKEKADDLGDEVGDMWDDAKEKLDGNDTRDELDREETEAARRERI